MDLIIIFAQRKEDYHEQFAPEIINACTEYELEDGAGDYMDEQEKKARESDEFTAVKRVRVTFSDSFRKQVRRLLLEEPSISGERNMGEVKKET